MDITLIAIASFILLAIILVLIFLFNGNKKTFKADDGSVFDNQSDLDKYNSLYEQTTPFFNDLDEKGSNQELLGFERSFLKNLTKDGFRDLKTLIKYRKQLKSLSDLINT